MNHAIPRAIRRPVLFFGLIIVWIVRHRTRCALRKLDDHLLADIGLDAGTVRAECDKGFWRA